MYSLVIKKDCDKEMQSQQSFHIGHIEYARNSFITASYNKFNK